MKNYCSNSAVKPHRQTIHCSTVRFKHAAFVTEKYRPEPGLEPRVSRLAHECLPTELSKPTQFCYSNSSPS